MQPSNRCLGCPVVRHLDKAKAAEASRLPIGNEADTIHHTIGCEQFAHVLFCDSEREIPHKNIHQMSLLRPCQHGQSQACDATTAPEAMRLSTEVCGRCEEPLL